MITTLQWIGALMASLGMMAAVGVVPVYIGLKSFEKARRKKLDKLQKGAMTISFSGLALVLATGFMG